MGLSVGKFLLEQVIGQRVAELGVECIGSIQNAAARQRVQTTALERVQRVHYQVIYGYVAHERVVLAQFTHIGPNHRMTESKCGRCKLIGYIRIDSFCIFIQIVLIQWLQAVQIYGLLAYYKWKPLMFRILVNDWEIKN